jgi:hypothetical protein
VAIGILLSQFTSLATPINYGNFPGTTVEYLDVTEESGTDLTPLYGAPSVSGDSLIFTPVLFTSSSAGAAGADITDGTLGLTIQANPGESVPVVEVTEAGDYTLTGIQNDALAGAQATYFLDIEEVDGVSINIIQVGAVMTFAPSGGTYYLSVDGAGVAVPWSGSVSIDIEQALIDANIPFTVGATRVTIVADNTLTTLSQDGTSASISKSNVTITVPEPDSLVLILLGAGLCSIFQRSRRIRQST